jgi:ectoine hydroxylase-related dioxygenase (phytanoyl-CoA dioxygenase family)
VVSVPTVSAVSAEEVETFHRDGAVIIHNVIEPQWLEVLAAGLDRCNTMPGQMSSALVDNGREIRIDQFPAARSDKLRDFIHNSPAASLVGAVLGGDVRFYMDQMFVKPAGAQMATAWHQDTGYYNVDGPDLVRAWVSPDPVPRAASLEVVRGSHLWNVTYRPLGGRDPRPEAAPSGTVEQPGEAFSYSSSERDRSLPRVPAVEARRGSFDIIGWDYEPGDVILFNGNILHGARGDHVLQHARRAHATMYAGPGVHYLERVGQVIPDPVGLAADSPTTGQPLADFPDIFPLVWPSEGASA